MCCFKDRGIFEECHQLHTVALSFLPYVAGKQQLSLKMPKTRHLRQQKSSQRDDQSAMQISENHNHLVVVFLCSKVRSGPRGRG